MKFQPSTFYINIIDLFAILLPGAICSLILYHFFQVPIDEFLNIGENQKFYSSFVLIFSSYLFGHMISQISSYLDKYVYDKLKFWAFRNKESLNKVKTIRKENYNNTVSGNVVNSFKWSYFKLQKEQPHAISDINRYMADSKFFRGLFVILFILTFVFLLTEEKNFRVAASCSLLALFSMIRYFKKRNKAIETAYHYIIFSEELNNKSKASLKDAITNVDKKKIIG